MAERFRDPYDLRIFQQFPRSVRVECRRGRVLSSPDERFLYDVAVETIRGRIHARHYASIGERAIASDMDLSGVPPSGDDREHRHGPGTICLIRPGHSPGSGSSGTALTGGSNMLIENVFDICAMLNTDLRLGVPGTESSAEGCS